MKTRFFTKIALVILFTFSFSFLTFGQTPEMFKYQAVLRDANGNIIANQNKTVIIDILLSDLSTSVFTESHSITTTAQGLINISIGSVNTTDLSNIDWTVDEYFIQITVDGTIMGASQLLSVPYALHAKTAESFTGTFTETDPIFVAHPANGINATNITDWNTAFGWGNHASAGYLTSFTEIDPIFTAHPASGISSTNITNWNSAFGWGDHAGLYRPISWVPSWTDVTGKPTFATVATSGSYDDLINKPAGNNPGDMLYWNGTTWVNVPAGTVGQIMTVNASGLPTWQTPTFISQTITTAATNISITAQLNGIVNANGLSTTVTFEYGTTIAYGNTVTATQSPVIGNANTNVNATTIMLTANTTYHFRVKAVNSAATTYGNDMTFTTGTFPLPGATTAAATNILTTAQLNGIVNANNISTTVTFEYGTTTAYGNTVTAAQSPVTGNTNTNVNTTTITLAANTTYHFRVRAVSVVGTTFGDDMTFTTGTFPLPSATTAAATSLSYTAVFNGVVNANDVSTTVTFEYGTTTAYGNTVAATPSPVIGSTNTNVSATSIRLSANTTYHFRVKAESVAGITYGDDMTFTTDFSVGTYYQGGIIAYILQSGDPGYVPGETHGIIAATVGQGIMRWYNGTYILTGAAGTDLGTGSANTTTIIDVQGNTGYYAAKVCRDYTGGGYSDWSLPSKDEIMKLYLNRVAIGGLAYKNWTSTEFDQNNVVVYTNGYGYWNCDKNNAGDCDVRPIRYF